MFGASAYYSVLGTLGLLGDFEEGNNIRQALVNFAAVIGIFMIAAHFIGSLTWGLISPQGNYDRFSINWWCCIYLISVFAMMMELFVVQPLLARSWFVEISEDVEERTGKLYNYI